MRVIVMAKPAFNVDISPVDYLWHAYCQGCTAPDGGGNLSVATAHTLDSVRMTKLVNAVVQHRAEVHGGE